MWIISYIECNTIGFSKEEKQHSAEQNNAEIIHRQNFDKIVPVTHMELAETKRLARKSDFDLGYDEFLRNYHDDDVKRHGRYRVRESGESDTNESDETNGTEETDETDDDNGPQDESSESEVRQKRYKIKPQGKLKNNKNNSKTSGKKDDEKSRYCKMEKRKNMICKVCYNPKNDENSESCTYSSEPKEHNYAYSEDSTFGGKEKEPESLENDLDNEAQEEEQEEEAEEEQEEEPEERVEPEKRKHIYPKKKNPPSNKYPVYNNRRPHQGGGYYLSFVHPHPNQNYGPQTFRPQSFRITRSRGNPIRYQTKPLPPNVTLIRYKTIESPFTSERIRLITYPNSLGPYPTQNPSYNNHRPSAVQDVRPPRDIHGTQSESLLSNVTKEHEFEYLPSHRDESASQQSLLIINKDGYTCRKSVGDNKVCFECYVDGERRKECTFSRTNKPKHFYESYSTTKKSKKSNDTHPFVFETPPETRSQNSYSQQKYKPNKSINKSKNVYDNNTHLEAVDYLEASLKSTSSKPENYEKLPSETEFNWNSNQNHKRMVPQSQKLRAVPDIIYGTHKSTEQLALFYQSDPIKFHTNNNDKNIHLNY